jgi:hypothetical protein
MRVAQNLLYGIVLTVFISFPASAEKTAFPTPGLGRNLGVWRLTHDPTVRHHANYHNTQCWSPDGRFICYTTWGGNSPGDESTASVQVYDTRGDTTREIGQGNAPRWARHHNWLFYVDYSESRPRARTSNVVRVDIDNGERAVVAKGPGPEMLGETDFQDRWLYGALRFRKQQPEFQVIRINITGEGGFQRLPEAEGSQLLPNPRHPLFFTRQDHKQSPFAATRWWYDLDGSHKRIAVATLEQCHMCWLGNGQYMLLGNGPIRGRRWDEPFPSNIHILAAVGVGDVSPCGTSGRYACGDQNVADLRSGDGFTYIEPLSIVCFPKTVADASGIYDADPKGSPDGTKICFVSNYDLKDGPATRIAESLAKKGDRLIVESTEGFPATGAINVQREVIGYRRKTAKSFEGLSRALYDTAQVSLVAGRTVTSFDVRCLSDAQWKQMGRASAPMRKTIADEASPLLRQRQTDVYVAVVRKPDRPWLRIVEGGVQLIPGENHAEIAGYRLWKDGQPLSDRLIEPGQSFPLDGPAQYRAVAVEWSGLQSEPASAIRVERSSSLAVLSAKPEDFSWTADRWTDTAATVKEVVHRYDGVIRREWYSNGAMVKSHDLNHEGKPIRRVEYRDSRIAVREYYTAEGLRTSRELFDASGFITETVHYAKDGTNETDHWWFDRGMPVRQLRKGTTYVKQGDRFGQLDGGRFLDTPRGAKFK